MGIQRLRRSLSTEYASVLNGHGDRRVVGQATGPGGSELNELPDLAVWSQSWATGPNSGDARSSSTCWGWR